MKLETEEYDLKHFLEEAKQLSVFLHNTSITDEGKTPQTKDNLARTSHSEPKG